MNDGRAMVNAGFVQRKSQLDPVAERQFGPVNLIDLSVCLVYDPSRMAPGYTVPVDQARSMPVGEHQVAFPSDKGMLIRQVADPTPAGVSGAFCCAGPFVKVPIAMCDGAAITADRSQLLGGQTPVVIDLVGIPVFSSWGGYLARDRQQ